MQRTRMLAGTALATLSLQALALGGGQDAGGCPPGQAGSEHCARVQRVRVELPPSPALPAMNPQDLRAVSTLPQPDTACRGGAPAGYTTSSSGRITRAGC